MSGCAFGLPAPDDDLARSHVHTRPEIATIAQRPVEVNDHRDGSLADHVVGTANRSATANLGEQTSRYSTLITLPEGYDSRATLEGCRAGSHRP